MKTLQKLLLPGIAALATILGGLSAEAQAKPLSPREQLEQLRAMRQAAEARNAGEVQQVSQPVNPPVQQAPPGPSPVIPVAPVVSTPQQEQVPSTPFQTGGGSSYSLFGGDDTNLKLEGEFSSTPSQTNSKAGVTLAPKGKPFLMQVTGYQSSGTCPAGPGGTCSYDSSKLDIYGALRGWSSTTEWNIGPFIRFQDNHARGTWRSTDGKDSGEWKSDNSQTDAGIRARIRHRLNPNSAANPWIGAGGEYDFINGGFDLFGEGGIRPGNAKNPWNLYVQGGVNTDGGYFYPEITTPNLVGDANAKLQVQLQAKGVFYGMGRENSTSRVELGVPLTLNLSRNTAIQVTPSYVMGLDPNTKSGFGGTLKIRFGF